MRDFVPVRAAEIQAFDMLRAAFCALTWSPLPITDPKFGMIKLASTPIIAMTMSSSTSVKPFDVFLVFIKLLGGVNLNVFSFW